MERYGCAAEPVREEQTIIQGNVRIQCAFRTDSASGTAGERPF